MHIYLSGSVLWQVTESLNKSMKLRLLVGCSGLSLARGTICWILSDGCGIKGPSASWCQVRKARRKSHGRNCGGRQTVFFGLTEGGSTGLNCHLNYWHKIGTTSRWKWREDIAGDYSNSENDFEFPFWQSDRRSLTLLRHALPRRKRHKVFAVLFSDGEIFDTGFLEFSRLFSVLVHAWLMIAEFSFAVKVGLSLLLFFRPFRWNGVASSHRTVTVNLNGHFTYK